ncbi:SoxR reducing system RseC family protein [Shewanella sp. SR44-3]|uniref:SoxR reducing system RseC family protein n=1 Tax=unclassified Shewanella TaxID=196818 RepID=UPI0015FDF73C|nr:SoxR reducing system RseC family protein [Shewanella sp. SR44-3]MBB1269837.1 SoxR reducing system RseC family protein [Shewanella sp. SR44-3]
MSHSVNQQNTQDADNLLEEVGRIVAYDDKGWVRVEVELKSACNHCSNSDSCGTSAVAKAFSVKTQQFSLPCDTQYPIGDLVKLGLPASVLLKAAALVYLLPLSGLFLGAVLGQILSQNVVSTSSDLPAIACGAIGAFSAWVLGRRYAHQLEQGAQPVIIAHLGREIGMKISAETSNN